MQGWRSTMEDAHAAIPDLDASTSFFGVYDGHGGYLIQLWSLHLNISNLWFLNRLWTHPLKNTIERIHTAGMSISVKAVEEAVKDVRKLRSSCNVFDRLGHAADVSSNHLGKYREDIIEANFGCLPPE